MSPLHKLLVLLNAGLGSLLVVAGSLTSVLGPGGAHWVGVAILVTGAVQTGVALLLHSLFGAAPPSSSAAAPGP